MNGDYWWFRALALLMFVVLHVYWRIADKGLDNFFQRGRVSLNNCLNKSALSYFQFIVVLQLLGVILFQLPTLPPFVPLTGLTIMFIGLLLCLSARHALGKNWTNAKDYHTKNPSQLITRGIYASIRHPIYLGVTLMITGGELITANALIILLPLVYIWAYQQAKREEVLLTNHFGNTFIAYQNATAMFIPHVF
jgi:protein-S-isoprenylcysteine O-methyltransferase Ste14